MPQSLSIGLLVLGGVLVLLSLVVGKFKLFGAEVDGKVGWIGRVIAFVLGLILICVSVGLKDDRPSQPTTHTDSSDADKTPVTTRRAVPEEANAPEKPSLKEQFEDYLVGEWQDRSTDRSTGVVVTDVTRFTSNGTFSEKTSVPINGRLTPTQVSGTWSVRPISTDKFVLIYDIGHGVTVSQTIRVIDQNTVEDENNEVSHRTVR